MGLTPLGPGWPEGHEPTEEERAEYLAYLERCIIHSRASMGVSLGMLALLAVFLLAVGLWWWLV